MPSPLGCRPHAVALCTATFVRPLRTIARSRVRSAARLRRSLTRSARGLSGGLTRLGARAPLAPSSPTLATRRIAGAVALGRLVPGGLRTIRIIRMIRIIAGGLRLVTRDLVCGAARIGHVHGVLLVVPLALHASPRLLAPARNELGRARPWRRPAGQYPPRIS